MLTIAVAQQKGGSGKTTLTINLAAAACLERGLKGGHRTLILDMDRQGSASDWRLTVPADSPLQELEVKQHAKSLDVPRFEALTSGFDYVFIDCPGRGDELAETAAALADFVVIPLQPGPLDFFATQRTLEGVASANDWRALDRREPVACGYVLNRVDGTRLAAEAERALRAAGGAKFLGTVYQRVAFRESLARGESVFTFNATAKLASVDIAKLWRAVKKEATNGAQFKASGRGRAAAKGRQSGKAD